MKCPQLRTVHGLPMHHNDIKAVLGFKRGYKYRPDESWTRLAKDGTCLTLLTVEEAASVAKASIHAGSHRLFAQCMQCIKMVPAGRLHQHYKKH